MKTPSVLLLAGALTLAGGAALLARVLLAPAAAPVATQAPEAAPSAVAKSAVLVATRELKPGQFIDHSLLRWQETDSVLPADQVYLRGQDDMGLVVGATVRRAVAAGQPLYANALVRPGEPGFLASVLTPGMRALTLPTTSVAAGQGLVGPGDRVDIILSLNSNALKGRELIPGHMYPPPFAAQTLLRDVRVLAINRNARSLDHSLRAKTPETSGKAKADELQLFDTVSVEVTPRQAERLALSKEVGVLQLALRSNRETSDGLPRSGDRQVTRLDQATDIYPDSVPAPVMLYRGNTSEIVLPPSY
ncbi:MAG: Flp pilus assembly protein CpaB [Paucimonas sp.]|jgi:pilus assembly protein CpaB|nr:Flp pilus assembly protein CpaB [Paucimonas sp.]